VVSFLVVVTICPTWSQVHCRIVADESGLRYVNFFKTRCVSWTEVEDYELRIPSSSQSKSRRPNAYLKFDGRWVSVPNDYTLHDELLQTIEREARWSKARSWQQKDLREDGEWSKSFEYHDTSGWKLVGMYFLITFMLVGITFLKSLTYGVARTMNSLVQSWNTLSPLGRLSMGGLTLLVLGSYPLVVLTPYAGIKRRRAFLGQKIAAGPFSLHRWRRDLFAMG
jgi:hypothetical protein